MANAYSKIYIHTIFAVKYRQSLILPSFEEKLFQYITGTVQGLGQKMLIINGIPDHIHFMIGMKPDCRLSDLVREVKKASTAMIKEQGLTPSKFQWQEGYGAFSVGHTQLDMVGNYIRNQKEHHGIVTFKDEYFNLLNEHEVEFKEEYVMNWIYEEK